MFTKPKVFFAATLATRGRIISVRATPLEQIQALAAKVVLP